MRIFLTGGTGYVGGAVLDALLRGGHDVTVLVRDNEKSALVAARGAMMQAMPTGSMRQASLMNAMARSKNRARIIIIGLRDSGRPARGHPASGVP